ncbi:MAG: glycosyltransferase family A protein [Pseudomonadota bacterium]
MEPYSIVITSCGRFDLLKRTVDSLLAHIDGPLEKIVVIEDSGDDTVQEALAHVDRPVEFIVNRPQLGQIRAIDTAYAAVSTPYIFHCEDDWEFFRTGFIAESFKILNAHKDVSMVGLRPRTELNPLVRETPVEDLNGLAYFRLDPTLHPEYFSYSFNPGLRRRNDYEAIGPFEKIGPEADVSYAFKKAGFSMAYLEDPAVAHIGDGRHVADPHGPKRPTNVFERLQRSIEKRLKRRARKQAEKEAS